MEPMEPMDPMEIGATPDPPPPPEPPPGAPLNIMASTFVMVMELLVMDDLREPESSWKRPGCRVRVGNSKSSILSAAGGGGQGGGR
jgi:hypothetical protein